MAKLTLEQVREIRALAQAGASRRSLARKFGVYTATISNVLDMRTWRTEDATPVPKTPHVLTKSVCPQGHAKGPGRCLVCKRRRRREWYARLAKTPRDRA